jgi:hypothetical protein
METSASRQEQSVVAAAIVAAGFVVLVAYIAWSVLMPQPVAAAWNQPTCNPDTVGPTDPTCNVSAPLNISSAGQTKLGSLTIQNTVSAADLVVTSALGGNGGITITTSSGRSILIAHTDPAEAAIFVDTVTTAPGIQVNQTGAGDGIFSQATDSPGIVGFTSDPVEAAVYGENTSTGAAVVGINNSATEAAVTGQNNHASGLGAVEGCNNTNGNCAYLGTGTYAGLLQGRLFVDENIGSTYTALIKNTNATGNVLDLEHGGVSAGSIPTSHSGLAPNPTSAVRVTSANTYGVLAYSQGAGNAGAILGTATAGYGVIGWSTGNYGIYGNTTEATTYYGGIFCNQQTNCAFLGGPLYAANFNAPVNAVISNTSYVGRFQNSNSSGEGLRVRSQTGSLTAITVPNGTAVEAQSGSGPGVLAHSSNNIGLYAEGATIAAQVVGKSGATGVDVSSTNATGVDIDTSGSSLGLNITMDDSWKTAIEANGAIVHSSGAFFGGQFYPYQPLSNEIYNNVDNRILQRITIGPNGNDILFDGADIWYDTITTVSRLNAVDGRRVKDYPVPGMLVRDLLYVEGPTNGKEIFVMGDDAEYVRISVLGGTVSPIATIPGIPLTDDIEDSITVKNSIWFWTDGAGLYKWDYETPNPATLVVPGAGRGFDLHYADNGVWVINSVNKELEKIDPTTLAIVDTIPLHILNPGLLGLYNNLEFDGQNFWVGDYFNSSIERVNVVTKSYEILDLSALGTDFRHFFFDGVKLWLVTYSSGYGSYDVAKRTVDGPLTPLASNARQALYDGRHIWVLDNSANFIYKLSTGNDDGYGSAPVSRGIYVYGQNGLLYCVYVNGAGTLTNSTTLTNCQ